jgi:hypothetical protein
MQHAFICRRKVQRQNVFLLKIQVNLAMWLLMSKHVAVSVKATLLVRQIVVSIDEY